MFIFNDQLCEKLKDARYKILVSCRPLSPARTAFNLALQGMVDAAKATSEADGDEAILIENELILYDTGGPAIIERYRQGLEFARKRLLSYGESGQMAADTIADLLKE